MNEIHKKALQKNHRLLINTLDLRGSNVLDLLLQDDVISSGEQDEILARTTQRDQNARLMFVLKRRGGTKNSFDNFLKALDTSYDFVAKELKTTVEKVKECKSSSRALCSHCLLMNNLIPADVSHTLYEDGIISDDDLEHVNNKNIPRTDRVHKLLSLLNDNPDQVMVFEKFCESLESKYNYIKVDKNSGTLKNCLGCSCSGIKAPEHMVECTDDVQACYVYESQSRGISNILPTVLSKRSRVIKCEDEVDGYNSNITRAKLTDLFKEQAITENLEPKNARKFKKSRDCLSETFKAPVSELQSDLVLEEINEDITADERKKREASFSKANYMTGTADTHQQNVFDSEMRLKIQTGNIVNKTEISRSSVNVEFEIPECGNSHPSNEIVQVIPKTLPNNKKLMRKCTRLWDKLFFLRERGDWETFNLVSVKAFEKFSTNPDIQVLLYRSEMCVSTFYNNDREKASVMYDKAMDLLPKTCMPTWHLARLLPLKVELCARAKKFEKASSLLEQAHQAIITLGPCLSTGAVHFFEAIYLSSILRCTRYGTKSFASVSERVKMCFLTAIEHYQQEKFFAIQSFLNQVYLFLALFSLGVDFKNIGYIKTQKVAEEDIALAEHYMNLFENSCWDDSTNWSRMLFFIARAEQHKQRNNFSRCLDYFKEARGCADKGKFVEHLEFVENNIQWVGDKINDEVHQQELNLPTVDAILQGLSDSSGESGSGED